MNKEERLNELKLRLENIPSAIENVLKERREQEEIIDRETLNLKFLESDTRVLVTSETSADGKKKFSNEQQRDDETSKRLYMDKSYQDIRKILTDASKRSKELVDTVDVLKLKFSATKKIVDMELLEGGWNDE